MTSARATFVYRLEVVLRCAEQELDRQRIAAAAAQAHVTASQRALQSCLAEAHAAAHAVRADAGGQVDPGNALRGVHHLARLQRHVQAARDGARRAEEAASEARSRVAGVHRRLEGLRRHRDAAYERHRRVFSARQAREIDAAGVAAVSGGAARASVEDEVPHR